MVGTDNLKIDGPRTEWPRHDNAPPNTPSRSIGAQIEELARIYRERGEDKATSVMGERQIILANAMRTLGWLQRNAERIKQKTGEGA